MPMKTIAGGPGAGSVGGTGAVGSRCAADAEAGELARQFGVSAERVRIAMRQVGPLRAAVEDELRRQPLIEI